MGADTPAWVPPEAGAVRALPVAVTLIDQDRAWKTWPARSRPIATPEVYDEGFWSRVDVWAGQFGRTPARWHCAGIRGARGGVMAWLAAGYGVAAARGLRGEED